MARLGSSASPPRPQSGSSRPNDRLMGSSQGGYVPTSSNHPPFLVVIAMAVNALLSLGLLLSFSDSKIGALGVAFGMFGSVILLGVFRQKINLVRADGKFMDWRFSSNSVATVLTLAAWLTGVGSLFLLCYEISRNYTS